MNATPSDQRTTGTFAYDDLLPRVPLPTLAASCERFLEWSAPLLTPAERAATAAAVTAFQGSDGPGPVLHAALERYEATEGVRSWLDDFWDSRYLGRRDRIALNANYIFLFADNAAARAAEQPQVERAAGLIAAAVDYKLRLDDERIEPVRQRGQVLSMAQNTYLFSTTRIPGAVQDTVRTPYSEAWPGPSPARHIVVFHRGNIIRLDVVGPDGQPYTLDDLTAGLTAALKAAPTRAPADVAVGQLTTKARAAWAQSRERLSALDPANAAALDTIETALFCLCLEEATPADNLAACDQLLHGDAGNRWFDKAVSLIVFPDGRAGINVEHCGLDGTTILSFVDDLLSTSPQEHSASSGAQPQGLPAVEPVEFVLDADLRADIAEAGASFTDFAAATASTVLSFDDFGQQQAKALRTSPDAFVQLAYQLAHVRAKGHVGATYESIATRQWRRGRTEAMRVVTPQIHQFVAAMQDPAADPATKRAAFRAAADAHVRRAKDCQAGRAPEQHLWELQFIARRQGAELGVREPIALYDSPGWVKTRDDFLSTSSAPSVNVEFFGFGSTSSQCIGVAYVLLPDRFNLYLSTPRAVAGGLYAFAEQLALALRELQDLLADEPPAQ
ncbi:choline/carnitine O-acyltransferase [Frankia sp. AvcI1]|uniref:choline/carnitine O-acyltransferase n=1 Tax=Frankia sp. AvcI1 TaxID=573496 RepID=UPI002117D4F2|nr:choline/carnitine O-acyltransferase [Frankia sp. AvcI1]